jgi:SAM-dependent methyltransferase
LAWGGSVLRREALGYLAAIGLAGGATGEDTIWKDYVAWYRKQPDTVSDLRAAYLEYLKRSGVNEAEAAERCQVVDRLVRQRREELQPAFFDRTYSTATPRFNTGPNALLVETVRDLEPGRALDVDMGQGRNAIFLAYQGRAVTGFDYSAEGIAAARRAAAKAGVSLDASVGRHEDFDFGRARWDLILMSYTWVPLRPPYLQRIIDALKPGGVLVFEHLMDESGSQRSAAWLPKPNQLLEAFGALRILRYEDSRAQADWSWRPERIARLLARK